MNQLIEWLTIEDPLIRLWMTITGVTFIVLSIGAYVLMRATDPPYRGERRRTFRRKPWQRDPYTGRPRLQAEAPVRDHVRPLYAPHVSRQPVRGAFAMPRTDVPTHHRARGGRQEGTRRLHPGDVMTARAMVPTEDDPWVRCVEDVYPPEGYEPWELRRLRRNWREEL